MHALKWSRSDYLTLLSLHWGLQFQLPYTGTAYDWDLHVAPLANIYHCRSISFTGVKIVTKLS